MRLLLDSHAALWALIDSDRLGPVAKQMIFDAETVVVSVVTPWELGIKRSAGKLDFPEEMVASFVASGYEILQVSAEHAVAAPALPMHHRDLFDRMLIAQARHENLTVVTSDAQFDDYDVDVLDASK